MSNNFKKAIDRQMWVQVMPSPNAHAAGGVRDHGPAGLRREQAGAGLHDI